ncbi:CAMK family protein kinase [Histomonas meleagridis]|uniref:CAMK family protein kinase n=1 Tax=Histomonas meleagridis TaxID=135588 RepID=UPI00355ABD11|nr:CAMK family protein kinase [Histomonas meleagridis]KAH0797088.1 CAMK family protein kinase [Histomonas meleagridis]
MLVPQLSLTEIQGILPEHHYHYIKAIGMGGYGSIFLVRSDRYNQDFCIKRIQNPEGKFSNDTENEAATLIRLCHPNIISMYEFFFDQNHATLYMVLEYCSGGSLKDLIEREGPIRPPKLYSYCYQILNALLHCHDQNIAHRDIKPANILLDKYDRPKLADFGLSKKFEKGESLISFAGSHPYMAPEIICRQSTDPFLADIWSLGVTFYTIAFGMLPWGVCNEHEMDVAIQLGIITFPSFADQDFCNLIRSMVVVNPSKRKPLKQLLMSPIFQGINKYNYSSVKPLFNVSSQIFSKRRSSEVVPSSFSHNRISSQYHPIKSYALKKPETKANHLLRTTFAK